MSSDGQPSESSQSCDENVALLAKVIRGRRVESRHWGHVVAVDLDGEMLFGVGNPDLPIFPRSCLKPLQALAGVVNDVDRQFEFSDAELAVVCGSHLAELRHIRAVKSILDRIGAVEGDLRCGPHAVKDVETRNHLIRTGQEPTAIYNNCSGKHAGMLALAKVLGASKDGYWNVDHPVQRQIQLICREMCDHTEATLESAVDGCAVPTYLVRLRELAQAFARLCAPEHLGKKYFDGCRRVSGAMIAEPEMVGGCQARDSILMKRLQGAIVCKGGAEGMQAIGIVGTGIGIAIKVEDGTSRALWPLCVSILQRFGIMSAALAAELLGTYAEIKNTRDERVGFVRSCI
jgi:L-asparaginase II